ncbi:MAG: type VI secretion system tube protein Hcp [Chitinophagales bacterium]|nr:type VI secretion system tube protein Hcp [Chitinophagales bacterium]
MKTLLIALFMIPLFGQAQTQDVFIKLTDANGKQINGTSLTRGYEKWITGLTISSSGKNNSQLNFTMQISGAAADLKRAMAQGEFLSNGFVSVTQPGEMQVRLYTITMEKIRVIACSESMGCNNTMTTTVVLSAARIGWTYFQTGKTGTSTISNKYGFDMESGKPWTNF